MRSNFDFQYSPNVKSRIYFSDENVMKRFVPCSISTLKIENVIKLSNFDFKIC